MGLDSVELVARFEKEFKIEVPDQDAENIATVGDMANWLLVICLSSSPIKWWKISFLRL